MSELCVDKLYVTKWCVNELCVSKLHVSGRRRRRQEDDGSVQPKTRCGEQRHSFLTHVGVTPILYVVIM